MTRPARALWRGRPRLRRRSRPRRWYWRWRQRGWGRRRGHRDEGRVRHTAGAGRNQRRHGEREDEQTRPRNAGHLRPLDARRTGRRTAPPVYPRSPSREAAILDRCFDEGIPPATAPIVLQEFLQGFARAADLDAAQLILSQFDRLPAPSYATHAGAAALHRDARREGDTIPTVASLIVQMALEAGLPLLTADAHQRRLARMAGVDLL